VVDDKGNDFFDAINANTGVKLTIRK